MKFFVIALMMLSVLRLGVGECLAQTLAPDEAALIKNFFTHSAVDANGAPVCKETDSSDTCLARAKDLCYQQDGSKGVVFTSGIQSSLCGKLGGLPAPKKVHPQPIKHLPQPVLPVQPVQPVQLPRHVIPNYIPNYTPGTARIEPLSNYTPGTAQPVLYNSPVATNAAPIIPASLTGSFELGASIDSATPDITNKAVVLNPSNNTSANTLQVNQDPSGFTMDNPRVNISRDENGNYAGNWFAQGVTPGLITTTITDKSGKVVYSDQMSWASTVGFKDFTLDKAAIDPNKEYTLVISGGGKSGSYKFSGDALTGGGAVANSAVTTQYSPKNSYLDLINGAVSKDGQTLSLDMMIGKGAGPITTNVDIRSLVVKDKSGNVIKTVTGDGMLKALGGGQLNVGLDLSNGTDYVVELIGSGNNVIESYNVNAGDSGLVKVAKTVSGASGFGSVYDPIVNYGAQSGPQGYNFSINVQAAGASAVQVIDAASGEVISTYNSSDKFSISGSQKTFKQGQSYYIKYYDPAGNVAYTQQFTVGKNGAPDIQDINKQPTLVKACGGKYVMNVDGKVDTITIDGKSYTLEEAKAAGMYDPSLPNRLLVSSSLQNITVTYVDGVGGGQSTAFEVQGGNAVCTDFSNTIYKVTPLSTVGSGPINVSGDTTAKYEEPKVVVDNDAGTITVPIAKLNQINTELAGNKVYNKPVVQALISEATNDPDCKTHSCGFSEGGYTVTTNPSAGKLTVEVDKTIVAANTTQANANTTKASANKKATLDTMLKLGMVSQADYNKQIAAQN